MTKQNENLFPMTTSEYHERVGQLVGLISSRDAFIEDRKESAKEAKEQLDGMNESITALAQDLRDRAPKGVAVPKAPARIELVESEG